MYAGFTSKLVLPLGKPGLAITSSAALGKILNLFEPQCPLL